MLETKMLVCCLANFWIHKFISFQSNLKNLNLEKSTKVKHELIYEMDFSSSPIISMSSARGLSTSVVVFRCCDCFAGSFSKFISDKVILLLKITAGSSTEPFKSLSVTSSVCVSASATRIWDSDGSDPSR